MTAKKKNEEIETTQKRCFVVGPIGQQGSETRKNADWVLEGIIRPVLEKHGYTVKRADGITKPGNIDTQVINEVIDAELVIADLSEHNANAFYELGLRHMSWGKPVIHMIRQGDKIPFDNNTYRTIVFDHSAFQGMETAKNDLEAQVVEVQKDGFIVETPVSRAKNVQKIEFEGSDFEKTIQDQISELKNEILRYRESHSKVTHVDAYEEVFFRNGWVKHTKFGEGQVIDVDGNIILVKFGNRHIKVMKNFLESIDAPINDLDDEIPF